MKQITDLKVGDVIKMTGVDEQTGETQTKEGRVVEIDEKHREAKFEGPSGKIIAKLSFSPFYDADDAKFRSSGGQLIATIHTVEIVSREPRDVDFDDLESCVSQADDEIGLVDENSDENERVEIWNDRLVKVVRDENGHFVAWSYIKKDSEYVMPTLEQIGAKNHELFGQDPEKTVDDVTVEDSYVDNFEVAQ